MGFVLVDRDGDTASSTLHFSATVLPAGVAGSPINLGLTDPVKMITSSPAILGYARERLLLCGKIVMRLDEELIEDWEGCLSIPDMRGRVPRWSRLRVDGLDRHGNRLELTAEGFAARVIQHEFDHLMGKVYLDRMRDFKTLTHVAEFQRFWLPEQGKT